MLDFLLPSLCLLCEKNGKPICLHCLEALQLKVQQTSRAGFDLWYLATYNDAIAKIVLAIKDKGRTSLISALVAQAAWPQSAQGVSLVPIPSSRDAEQKRGFSHTEIFAKKIAARNHGLRVAKLLRSKTRRLDQAGLSVEQRKANLSGAFEIRRGISTSLPVVLVDDVYTTGATMAAARETLEAAGYRVLGGWVLALVD
ncbi:MAG: hypothetical protein RLZZ556_910 [Actinomycetota bacterium]